MLTLDSLDWRDHLVLTREIVSPGERAEFFARVSRGEFVSLRRGVYIGSEQWSTLDADARYRARIKGVVAFAERDLVISHHSAAALWRLPRFGNYPKSVHVLDDHADGGRSSSVITRHAVGVPEAIDMPPTVLVRDDLFRELSLVPLRHGSAKARRAIGFADAAADRPGESLSRVNISLAGLTTPRLQVPMRGASGKIWTVGFWWEEFNLIGEFDGDVKYTNPEFLRGRTPQQVLRDERAREDDLRAAGYGMTRWPWEIAISISMPKLRRHLTAAGVR